jgi:hypothetical protein
MSRVAIKPNPMAFFKQLATPREMIPIVIILATTIFFYSKGGFEATWGCFICLVAVIAAMPSQRRQTEKRRRGKEILNRYTSSQR